MIKAISERLAWVGALYLCLGGMLLRCGACGPDFPNWLLSEGDDAVLRTPEAQFHKELQRMRLVITTNVARLSASPKISTLEMDVADLRKALEKAQKPDFEIESCIARFQVERWKLQGYAESREEDDANAASSAFPLVQVDSALPPEFSDYFRGAIAWHQTNFVSARAEWLALLKRPPGERHYKSTWAAFMLGKSWETEDAEKAIDWYRRVRELAQSGFADSLGLAVESLGWEARLEWQQKHYADAIDLYLEQHAAGDPTAETSLCFVAADALRHGRKALDPLARHPRAQRLITAYVISGGYREPTIDVDGPVKETGMLVWLKASAKLSIIPPPNAAWHSFRAPAILWLDAVESAKVRDVESAEQLALAAYQSGEMDVARRWLDRAKPTAVAQWLRAKLCLRDGKVADATELLAKVAGAVTTELPSTNSPASQGLQSSLFVDTAGDFGATNPAPIDQAVRGELAVAQLARRRYVETLDSLMNSSPAYWMDAAYVAERVLGLDELKTYVDRKYPEPIQPDASALLPGDTMSQEQQDYWPRRDYSGADGLRYLLGRRLARAYRFAEARSYCPSQCLPLFDELASAWKTAEDISQPKLERGQALVQAAVLTRKYGLELIGTEVEPDWRIHEGDFEEGVSVATRAALRGSNRLAPTGEELQKAATHGVLPEWRWHYRTVAAVIGWEAAKLLREAETAGQDPGERSRTLFAAATALHQHGIEHVPFGGRLSASSRETDANASIASRVAKTLADLSTKGDPTGGRPISSPAITPEGLWQGGFSSAALAWDSAQLLPNNSDETARILCRGGSWIAWDPPAADILYKALVRRCRKTAIGAEADRLRWFPRLDQQGNLAPRKTDPASAAKGEAGTNPGPG